MCLFPYLKMDNMQEVYEVIEEYLNMLPNSRSVDNIWC